MTTSATTQTGTAGTGFRRAYEQAGVAGRAAAGSRPAIAALSLAPAQVAAWLADHRETGAVLTLGAAGAPRRCSPATFARRGAPAPRPTSPSILAETQIDGIRSGRILATVDSQQYLQGYLAVEWLWPAQDARLHPPLPTSQYRPGPSSDLSNVDRAAQGPSGWAVR